MSRTRSIVTAFIASLALVGMAALPGCGEPILRNAPKPNPAAVAGAAAAAAAAITLASPQAAARVQEQKSKGEPDHRGITVHETVPSDVFDRLEHAPPHERAAREPGESDPASEGGVDGTPQAVPPGDDDVPAPPPMTLPPPREP